MENQDRPKRVEEEEGKESEAIGGAPGGGTQDAATSMSRLHESDSWDSVSSCYERWVDPFTSCFARAALLLLLLPAGGDGSHTNTNTMESMDVLDVACGTGSASLLAAAEGARVLAVDFSRDMVKRCAERLAAGGFDVGCCRAEVMDGQALDLDAGSFDRVLSIFGVFLFPDPQQGMREVFRVLHPGGLAAFSVWTSPVGAGPFLPWKEAFEASFPGRQAPRLPPVSARLCEEDTLRRDLESCGFQVVELVQETADWRISSVDELCAHADEIFGLHPVHAGLSADDRQALLRTLQRQLEDRFGAGEVSFSSTAHIVVVRKPDE